MSETNYVAEPSESAPAQARTSTVTERCSHCENEIEMRWDTETLGFQAFCPVCGERLMLCDACRYSDPPTLCDYNSETDRCRRMLDKKVAADDRIIVTDVETIRQLRARGITGLASRTMREAELLETARERTVEQDQ